ncbi:MAG: helix-turn-helix transcriptional regulator [Flavobacterium sp.]|nr:helix-turn-helix transcriptional regulator [Flavobacterium sp.]
MTTISRNLKKIRERNTKYNQNEVAELLGIKQNTYSTWESGECDVKVNTFLSWQKFSEQKLKIFFRLQLVK